MPDFTMDLRYAFRTLAKRPLFTATVLGVLALGIGPTVAIFTVLDTLLLRPLPYAEADRLVELADVYEGERFGVGQSEFRDWAANATVFEGIALAESEHTFLLDDSGSEAERIFGARATAGFFDVLGTPPLLGRTFLPGEDQPGRAGVVVLGYALWRQRFGGRPDIVGETIRLDHDPFTVVGVMPPGFFWIGSRDAEYYRPLGYRSAGYSQHQYAALARLKDGVDLGIAQAQMDVFARRAADQYPDAAGWSVLVMPLGGPQAQENRPPLLVMAVAVGLVQLLACANIAGLMMVRVTARTGELAVRAALGARPVRLLRELFVESGVLGVGSAGLGLLLTLWLLRSLTALAPPGIGLPAEFVIDGRVLPFSLLLVIITTALFALAPARRILGQDLSLGLSSAAAPARSRNFLRAVIVVEVGLAATLLVAAGLLLMSLGQLFGEDLGFDHEGLVTLQVIPPEARYSPLQRVELFSDLLEQIGALPGVESVAATNALPMSYIHSGAGFEIEGRPTPEEWRQQSAQWCVVTPGYFTTMGMALLQGRDFQPSDSDATAGVAIISESLARRHWSERDPVGQRIRERWDGTDEPWLTIIGVVADTRYDGPTGQPNATLYLPHTQTTMSWSWGMFVAARVRTRAEPVVAALRQVVGRIDPDLPLTRLALMDELIADTLVAERFVTSTLIGFALLAVVLSAVGLHGVVAQSVALRTRELGLRLALGATPRQLLSMVLRSALVLTAAGATWGMLLAAATTRGLEALLYGVDPLDPRIFAAAPLLLMAVALLASYLPARRAAAIDPIDALRAG